MDGLANTKNPKTKRSQNKPRKKRPTPIDFQARENIAKEFDGIIKELLPSKRYEKSLDNAGRIAQPDSTVISKKFPTSEAMMSYAIKNYADPVSGLKPDLQDTIKEIAEDTVASPVVNDAATIIDLSYDAMGYAQEQQNIAVVRKIQAVQKKAEEEITEETAINRFTDYHIATSNILSCQTSLGVLAE